MSKSLIQVVNQSNQNVDDNGIISLGTAVRRFGCNCRLSGNAIECVGEGYYTIVCDVAVTPSAAGAVVVELRKNGVQIPGAVAYGTTTGDSVTLPINATIRQGCCCDSADTITCVLIDGAGVVNNVSMRVEKA